MRKLTLLLAMTTFLSVLTIPLKAQEVLVDDQQYRIVDAKKDGSLTLIQQYDDMEEASKAYASMLSQYDNLCFAKGTTYLDVEVGLVSFHRSEGCDVNVEYNDIHTQDDGYTNGCYAGDGAYLTSDDTYVTFQLSGVQGQTTLDQVDILPFATNRVSYYMVQNNRLFHYIKTNVNAAGYGNILDLGDAPTFLTSDTIYYSYDGHYFYTDYALMISDYQNHTTKQATNANEPYYNYYQYISHRSSSQYSYEEFHQQLALALGIQKTMTSLIHYGNYQHHNLSESLVFQGDHAFFQYQNQFGVNALMMFSLAMNESNYGRSALAFSRNNLFGHAAYDNDVDGNASGYDKISDSIYYHAHDYISLSYLNPENFTYHGGHFGNKAGGMNIAYASDPYWGEKAAQFYLNIDEALGKKDHQAYRFGVSKSQSATLKQSPNMQSETLYQTSKGQESSFIIRNEISQSDGLWYEVASDQASIDGTYHPNENIAYIKAEQFDYVSDTKTSSKKYIPIHFDAAGGSYYPNQKVITQYVEEQMMPAYCIPEKEGYYFLNYQQELQKATTETTYVAQYEKIDQIEIMGDIQQEYAKGDYLNLNNAKLKITCGSNAYEIPITSDYVSNFTSKTLGTKTMTITYAGIQKNINYEIKDAKDTQKGLLQQKASQIITQYEASQSMTTDNIEQFNTLMNDVQTMNHPLDIETIRYLDRILEPYNNPRLSVVLKDDTYDLQASGLAFQKIPTSFLTSYVPVTLQISLQSIQHPLQDMIQQTMAYNFYQVEDVFQIHLKADFEEITPINDMVYSLQKPKDHENKLYRVFSISEDGMMIQVPSEQSKERITFQSKEETFILVSITQNGIVDTFDFTEVYHQQREMKNYISLIQTIAISAGAGLIVIILGIILLMRRKKHK